ncbi:MAG: ferrochelatase [Acidimicrobiales bacterium]
MTTQYDSIVLISFGGPEGPDDVVPFLRNVTRGRNIPEERLVTVGAHYELFGGVSPINDQNRNLMAALAESLAASGVELPVYWGNRNWHPLLEDTARAMEQAGHRRALGLVTSAFGSYSGCRQYSEDIERATAELDLSIEKVRLYWNHPGFLDAMSDRLRSAMAEVVAPHSDVRIAFTAHSIPTAWATASPYVAQLEAAARYLADRIAPGIGWELVFQSRSGNPRVPWLEPDICDHLVSLADSGVNTAVIVPIGFVSDHMEVVYDLDTEAASVAEELGLTIVRAGTAGTHPSFVAGLRDLLLEAINDSEPSALVGRPWNNPCHTECCARQGLTQP